MTLQIRDYLERGPASSKEIQAVTGLNQTAVVRHIRKMGDDVIKLRNGRSLTYAATCNAFGGSNKLPLSMVDAYGNTVLVAYVRPLTNGGFFLEPATGMPSRLLGEKGNGLYDDLPYFLYDAAPQGFMGRQIAKELASQSGEFPDDPKLWNTNHIGRYLVSNGDDLPGNFKFGEQALLRIRRKPTAVPDRDYPALADSVMAGVIPGSSAGGEQPKFTAYSTRSSSHVIVKFSPKGDNALESRWRDILLTEFHAIETIHSEDFPAAETRLLEMDGRLFLESQRFDRSGEYGRMSMVSLRSIDAEFTGIGGGWPQTLSALYKRNLISWQHVFDAEVLWCFGQLINNTDMHLGNLSFAIEGDVFRLLPMYDMCSMGFAPRSGGEIPAYSFTPPESSFVNLEQDMLAPIKEIAHDFWERVADDRRISDEFQNYLANGNPIDAV
ncbi:MAG: type II toxin-antitoxin system HipA family toxin YjjJ [Candidatus Sabulitectum sp.]|nr:type II toxin-antitoxin system HipA family toxin YjjJ [Candidatus Sabulitectum sp.]